MRQGSWGVEISIGGRRRDAGAYRAVRWRAAGIDLQREDEEDLSLASAGRTDGRTDAWTLTHYGSRPASSDCGGGTGSPYAENVGQNVDGHSGDSRAENCGRIGSTGKDELARTCC